MSSGATIESNRCCLAPTGSSLKRFAEPKLPFYTVLWRRYHIISQLSTLFRVDWHEKMAYNNLYFSQKRKAKLMKLSLIAPCYNEAENVQAFQDAVIAAFEG